MEEKAPRNRREFLKSAARTIILSGMGFAGVFAIRNKKININVTAICPVNPSCQGCLKIRNCNQLQVQKFRKESRKQETVNKDSRFRPVVFSSLRKNKGVQNG